MLRRIAPSGEEITAVRARFGIAQDSKPEPEALLLQAGIRREVAHLAEYLTTESPFLSAAPDPAIRLKALELALDYGFGVQSPRATVEAAEVFAAWVEGR